MTMEEFKAAIKEAYEDGFSDGWDEGGSAAHPVSGIPDFNGSREEAWECSDTNDQFKE